MSNNIFPPLLSAELKATLLTLQNYAKLIGKVRRAYAPRQKHWFHVSLRINATGLTTTAIPAGSQALELQLDLTAHRLVITTSRGQRWEMPLSGQSLARFRDEVLGVLRLMDFEPEIDHNLLDDDTPSRYERVAVERYWLALSQIDAIFKQFRGELRRETGPVQLWPHHLDLALLWFSGRLVPGQDPANEEYADEQMNFGFSPGDDGIPAPYFYATAYPTPADLTETPLPGDAYWHTGGFIGAVLPYQALVEANNPSELLLAYLRTVQQAGASLMK